MFAKTVLLLFSKLLGLFMVVANAPLLQKQNPAGNTGVWTYACGKCVNASVCVCVCVRVSECVVSVFDDCDTGKYRALCSRGQQVHDVPSSHNTSISPSLSL